ncbi:MAG: FtsX-like permease family protein, partial [Bacteroidota bacterium]
PTYYFSGRFLDRTIEDFYESEQKAFELFEIFSLIAIFIGAIGLFGLISFVVAQRTKEIGIRKVLGANLQQIIMLLNREFFVLVLMGFVLAAPLAWFFIDQWLAEFAFKIEPGVMAFGIALVASLVLVLLIVGSRTLRVAMTNPVTSLRDE